METNPKFLAWLKKIGWIGFFFFLAKGLFWLYLIYFGGKVLMK
jgi:hypothetical protein